MYTKQWKCEEHSCACATAYAKRKCRCDECKAWKVEANQVSAPARKKWFASNRDRVNASQAKYRKANMGLYAERCAARRCTKAKATPDLTEAEAATLRELYVQARNLTNETGIPHHVDHICPLSQGGVHHPCNLQVIPAEDNLKKAAGWDGVSGTTVEQFYERISDQQPDQSGSDS